MRALFVNLLVAFITHTIMIIIKWFDLGLAVSFGSTLWKFLLAEPTDAMTINLDMTFLMNLPVTLGTCCITGCEGLDLALAKMISSTNFELLNTFHANNVVVNFNVAACVHGFLADITDIIIEIM